jgi:hypothetical protein
MGDFSRRRDLLHHENFNGNIMDVKRLALIALNIILSGFWLISCVQRDKSKDMEYFWRKKYIESKALLGISIRQTDMVIMLNNYDAHTWDMYCQQKEAFKINLAKKLSKE